MDTNLIIKNINYKDNFARYKYQSISIKAKERVWNVIPAFFIFRFKCTGRNSLGISEKTITVHITGI